MKIFSKNKKFITLFDVVRLNDVEYLQELKKVISHHDDYILFITHGVIGELLYLISKNNFGLDKSKFIICCNNKQVQHLLNEHGYKTFNISEYIFLNDDFYNLSTDKKTIDCLFSGRATKNFELFKETYKNNIQILNKKDGYPFDDNELIEYYNKSYCGLMTTFQEGSCTTVGEMLLSGIPIISTKIQKTDDEKSFLYETSHQTYSLILNNTLGGRELWLNLSNSTFCDNDDKSIDESISILKKKNIDRHFIRNDFLSKLYYHRLVFLFLVKSCYDKLELKFNTDFLREFINLPYGRSSIVTTEWQRVVEYFNSSYQL